MSETMIGSATQRPTVARLWEAYGQGSALLWQAAPNAHIDLAPHGALTLSGEPFIEMNWGVIDAGDDTPDLLRRFVAAIRDRRLDAYLMATSAAADALEPIVGMLGVTLEPGSPLMLRRRTGKRDFVLQPETVTVDRVDDEWALQDVAAVVSRAFGAPPGTVERAFAPALLATPDLDVFVLRLTGEAASAVITTRRGDLTGIWAMGTLPELRRRHLGRHLLKAVMDYHSGLADPPQWFFLTASTMARPLYDGLGFEIIDECRFIDVLGASRPVGASPAKGASG